MSNPNLIEAIARGIWEKKSSTDDPWWHSEFDKCLLARELARAALLSIERSGTHVVVPVEPTEEMMMAGAGSERDYADMLAARPKV